MKKAVFILNPTSGTESASSYREAVELTLKEMGYETETRETQKEHDATIFAKEACENKADLVVAMGGDGTINEAVTGLAEMPDRPLFSLIPLGTVNDFARALGISLEPEEAIAALKAGIPKEVDIAKVADQYFTNILAIGSIAEATSHVSVEQKTKMGALAYFVEGLKALASDEELFFEIEYDNGKWEGEAKIILVALTNSVGGFEKLAPEAMLDDGLLHLFIVENAALPAFVRVAGSLLLGRFDKDPAVEAIKTKSVTIRTREPLTCNLDGEIGCQTPFSISILPRHIRVLAPPDSVE